MILDCKLSSLQSFLNVNLQPVLVDLEHYSDYYTTIVQDLASKQSQLTPTQIAYALNFILGVAVIEKNIPELVTILEETPRNLRIAELTGLIIEPGLVIGSESEEIKKCIEFRVNELVSTFFCDLNVDDTISFFREAFIGPPCFNGRFITMENYRCSKQLMISINDFVEETQKQFPAWTFPYTNKEIDKDAVSLEELIYEYLEQFPEKSDPPSVEEFIDYFRSNPFCSTLYNKDEKLFRTIYQRAVAIFKGY